MSRNDITGYLVQINLLNPRMEGLCPMYHDMIRAGLLPEIHTHISSAAEEPNDCTESFKFIFRMGKDHEEDVFMTIG